MRTIVLKTACVVALLSACLLAQSSATDPLQARLDRAKAVYAASIEKAKKQLIDDFESAVQAYTRAGKLDEALAVRKERDEFLEKSAVTVTPGDPLTKVEDGWTILFRSNNPFLWNVPVQNSESYAVPVTRAPERMKYLRMKRLDTGDFVVIELTREKVGGVVETGAYGWRGDRRLWGDACLLGVADLRSGTVSKGEIAVGRSGRGNWHRGWGFGNRAFLDDRQGYAWNGQAIEPTVIEIAVTARDLKPDEQKKLLK